MSPDWSAKAEPVPYAKLDNPQSLNLYAYVGNNPCGRTDADGHEDDDDCAACDSMRGSPFEGHGNQMNVGLLSAVGLAGAGNAIMAAGRAALGLLVANPQVVQHANEMLSEAGGPGGFNTSGTAASVNRKLSDYLLNTEHATGGPKAAWFEQALGFNKSNLSELAGQIKFDPKTAVQTGVSEFGTKYNQVINIAGANGKTIPVTFAWIKLNGTNAVNLITAIPTKKVTGQ